MQNFQTVKSRIINHLPNNRKKNQIYIWTINTKVVILHRKTCDDNEPSNPQWSVLQALFQEYGIPDNHLLNRYHCILSGIPLDEMHFLSADTRKGRSAYFYTDDRIGKPTYNFLNRLYVHHGLREPEFHLPGSHGIYRAL